MRMTNGGRRKSSRRREEEDENVQDYLYHHNKFSKCHLVACVNWSSAEVITFTDV